MLFWLILTACMVNCEKADGKKKYKFAFLPYDHFKFGKKMKGGKGGEKEL